MPEWRTPLFRPLACWPSAASFSRTTMRLRGRRRFSSRASARPTIPAPTTTKSAVPPLATTPLPIGSVSPVHAHDSRDGAKQNGKIASERPVPDIRRFERDYLFEIGDFVAPRHLPRPRQSRLYVEPRIVMRFVKRHFRRQRRPRSHERHVTLQNVDELRQLVEAGAP